MLTEAVQVSGLLFPCHAGGLTHEPVEKLSAKLQEWLPGDLDYCFFFGSGSVAVEVALKMALVYKPECQAGEDLSLTHSYHGDTKAAMEVRGR